MSCFHAIRFSTMCRYCFLEQNFYIDHFRRRCHFLSHSWKSLCRKELFAQGLRAAKFFLSVNTSDCLSEAFKSPLKFTILTPTIFDKYFIFSPEIGQFMLKRTVRIEFVCNTLSLTTKTSNRHFEAYTTAPKVTMLTLIIIDKDFIFLPKIGRVNS